MAPATRKVLDMADKLGESTWTGFLKKQKLELDDGALRKSLARFDKTDESKPESRLDALNDLVEQFKKQIVAQAKRKKELGDKPFALVKDQLYELLGEAEALQKKTQAAAAAEEDEEEPDTPVLLTTKMVPLLRELRKGETQMHALICTAGKNTAVLIMRRAISPSRRKLLAEAVAAKGGMKYIVGECLFENKALAFVVKSPGGQLAKRLRQALLEQTEMRLRVRVRGEDGVEEQDGEDEGEDQVGVQPQRTPAPQGGPASAEQLAYTQRLKKVRERCEQALREHHPESTKLRALMGFASEKADGQKDYAAAGKALEMLERLLGASADAVATFNARLAALMPKIKQAIAEAGPPAQDIKQTISEAGVLARKSQYGAAHALLDDAERALAAAPTHGSVARDRKPDTQASAPGAGEAGVPFDEAAFRRQWAAAKTSWRDALDSVDAQIAKLQVALRAQNDPELAKIADHGLNGVTGNFKVPLMAAVMDIDAARGEALRKAAQKGVRAARAFAKYLTTEETVRVTDENEFDVPVTIRSSLGKALRDIDAALAPLT
jgi:hypothetical protein